MIQTVIMRMKAQKNAEKLIFLLLVFRKKILE